MPNIQINKELTEEVSQNSDNSQSAETEKLVRDVVVRFTDEPYPVDRFLLDTMALLKEMDADQDTLIVAVLRGLRMVTPIRKEAIRKRLNPTIADLYGGAQQLDTLSINVRRGDVQAEISNRRVDFSRMLVAMVDDPRVVTLHLAELLVQMRQARHWSVTERKTLAEQVLSTYTPLANKLGMWRFKWELEDLSFKYLNRPEFDRMARQLDGRRVEREAYINVFVTELQQLMERSNIRAVVSGRAKHLFGIWRKLSRKGLRFDHLFDVRAVRILVDDVASCYAALGAVHASWVALEGEFDDYIAQPKPNGYQSLHTAVYGPQAKIVEVQIRTWTMHNDCEFGVAAHWLYKEDNRSGTYQGDKIRLLRQLMAWKEEVVTVGSPVSLANHPEESPNIYVFTPVGKVIELPAFSTPIDFAYFVHTEVGHRCRGARVNGRMVPLTHKLETGDWVEIQTVKAGGPSRDWLSSQQNFVVSSRAKACIRRWFKREEYSRYEMQGRVLLEKELSRYGLSKINIDKLALSNGYKNSPGFLAAIGMKELKPAHAIASLIQPPPIESTIKPLKQTAAVDSSSLSILGVDNLLTNHAACCKPLPGDDVIGYVTVARGITIHKRGCGNIKRMFESHPDRMVSVDWQHEKDTKHPVEIEIFAEGGTQLLQDIPSLLKTLNVGLLALNTPSIQPGVVGRISMTIEINSANQLSSLLTRLQALDWVIRARRVKS